jgi:anti-sigma factor RsiW
MSADLTCRELVDFLDDYFDGVLEGPARAAFHRHVAACPSCVAYMNTYRASTRILREALRDRPGLPEDVPAGLVAAILAARPLSP